MRLRDAVLKPSLGRLVLHHLASTYNVDVDAKAVACIEQALASDCADEAAVGAKLVGRLRRRGLVADGAYEPIVRRDASALVSLEIEPIGRCNLTCAHCLVAFSRATMSDAAFEAALDGARRLGAVEITLNGGEPLLHPRCLDWVDAIGRAQIRSLLFTNATLVTPEVAQRLAAARLARATVSVDGFERTHDELRGPGAFARAVRGIRALVAAGVSVFTTTVVHPGNADEVEAVRAFCLGELGVHGVRITTVAPLGRAAARPDLELDDAAFLAVYRSEPAAAPPRASAPGDLLPCRAGIDKLFVAATGTVHACHLFDGLGRPMGDLARSSLDLIHGAAAAGTSDELLCRFDVARLDGCAGCASLPECRGGCRARAWRLGGHRWAPDPVACRRRSGGG